MYIRDPNDPVHPLLKATLHLDETFDKGLRGDLIQPFPEPGPKDDYHDIWMKNEVSTRPESEEVIEFWIPHRHLPGEVGAATLFFLCKRFDQVSHFVRCMFLKQRDTIFSYDGLLLDDALWWLLVPWWDEHGSLESLIADSTEWEHKVFPQT